MSSRVPVELADWRRRSTTTRERCLVPPVVTLQRDPMLELHIRPLMTGPWLSLPDYALRGLSRLLFLGLTNTTTLATVRSSVVDRFLTASLPKEIPELWLMDTRTRKEPPVWASWRCQYLGSMPWPGMWCWCISHGVDDMAMTNLGRLLFCLPRRGIYHFASQDRHW